ncbi:alpha/beta hydrolase [Deinococcus koreensis]|uniref:Alpha/beta hydrolase n=1 Tax=Deinococcus koreensis TaxID=2054903 RepID=A0A2K3USR4_9DEIO|nr:alpha/beta hydrolase [Deinococcus koreensis]
MQPAGPTAEQPAGQTGSGPPVVLLHGIGRSLEDWEETVRRLAPDHRLLVPDLIGFGLSDKPDVPYTLAGLARFVERYLDAVGVREPVVLVGHSLGGAVAQQFAAQYPGRVRGLVLVGSAGFGQSVTLALRLLSVPGLGEGLLRPSPGADRRVVQSLFHDARHATQARFEHTGVLARQPGLARAYLRVVRHLGTWRGIRPAWRRELQGRLATLNVPTLIVWGERDLILPADHLEEARRAYPHALTHLYPDTGHLPQVEQADDFAARLRAFLKEEA